MLQIGICDDARESRFQLRALLERALEGRSAPARLLEFSSGDALLGWMADIRKVRYAGTWR